MSKLNMFYDGAGYCPICEKQVTFTAEKIWFRDYLLCSVCGSIPRERALMKVIADYFPNFRDLVIHESSPGNRGASYKLNTECAKYSASQFFKDITPGSIDPRTSFRCENLEDLTLPDSSIDIFITQDVMEHLFHPERAFKEISRVLKPGGAHIFSVPLINKGNKSERWASLNDYGETIFHHEPEYHGNPVDPNGVLVTMHWGYDIAGYISDIAGTPTTIIMIDDLSMGIRAEYIDIVISRKPREPE